MYFSIKGDIADLVGPRIVTALFVYVLYRVSHEQSRIQLWKIQGDIYENSRVSVRNVNNSMVGSKLYHFM